MPPQLSNGLHVGVEGVQGNLLHYGRPQDGARHEVVVVGVFGPQSGVQCGAEGGKITGRLIKGHKPIVVGQSTVCGSYLRGHREFPNNTRLFGNGRLESSLHFAANDVFAKGTDEVLDAPRNPDAERMKFGKFYGVAYGVTPQTGVGVQDECVVHAQLHFC